MVNQQNKFFHGLISNKNHQQLPQKIKTITTTIFVCTNEKVVKQTLNLLHIELQQKLPHIPPN
jgi:hypothetical protein